MSTRDDGGPAFPLIGAEVDHDAHERAYSGMSLRDYFAAKALPQVIIACVRDDREGLSHEEYFAGKAYALADAMLAERAK